MMISKTSPDENDIVTPKVYRPRKKMDPSSESVVAHYESKTLSDIATPTSNKRASNEKNNGTKIMQFDRKFEKYKRQLKVKVDALTKERKIDIPEQDVNLEDGKVKFKGATATNF